MARTLGVARRRDGLPWQASLGLLAAALLSNAIGLYGTGNALARALEPVPQPEREKVVEFDLVNPEVDNTFVQNDRPDGRVPEDTDRKGEHDSDVDKETQAPPSESATEAKRSPEPPKMDGKPDANDKQGDQDGDKESDPGDRSLVDASDGATANEGADSASKAGRPDPLANLGGSPSMLDQTFGRPGSNDRLRDVDEGNENVLDSKRHLFASFFNRLRDRVSENWRPEKVHKLADPHGTRFGDSSRMTVLMVRLDGEGKILKIEVERESGAPHLDEEAERAMRAAAPFPNLPEGLLDEKGHVDFRFGFILDFNGGSRIFRYN